MRHEETEIILTAWLRQLHQAVKAGTATIIHERNKSPPAKVKYAVFLKDLFASDGSQGKGIKFPDPVSAKRKC